MHEDPIVKEVHQIRERFAARFNHDTNAMIRYLREQEAKGGRQVVSRPPKAPPRKTDAA